MQRWFCTLTDGRTFDFSATADNKLAEAQKIIDKHDRGAKIKTIVEYKPEYKH